MEAFYDMALLSWSSVLNPKLPLLSSPPIPPDRYRFQDDHPHIAAKDLDSAKHEAAKSLQTHDYPDDLKRGQQSGYDIDYVTEKKNNEQGLHEGAEASRMAAITKHLSTSFAFILGVTAD